MAVPNTTTFSFIDVKNNVTGSPNSLTQAFAMAQASAFDPSYSGSKNGQLNFRNYDEGGGGAPSPVTLTYNSNDPQTACSLFPNGAQTYYVPSGQTFLNATFLWFDSGGTNPAANGNYSDGNIWRLWESTGAFGLGTSC